LDKLFSKKEIMDGAIEPTGAGKFPALDSARVAILKGNQNSCATGLKF
jgi:hypothetical protein